MNPQFAEIGQQFIAQYYQLFDSNRSQLASMYNEASVFTFEGTQFMGQASIMQHLCEKLTFQTVQHQVTLHDAQPTMDGGILVQVLGQLQTDTDQPQSFMQTFLLKQDAAGSWYLAHDIFRLVLHNG